LVIETAPSKRTAITENVFGVIASVWCTVNKSAWSQKAAESMLTEMLWLLNWNETKLASYIDWCKLEQMDSDFRHLYIGGPSKMLKGLLLLIIILLATCNLCLWGVSANLN
jgi:hypothetical protein